jgi:basic amino acid/polyamine antiporter, APA family
MRQQLFATKPLGMLMEEMRGENRLKRVLGPVGLTSMGVGAIIGTGIFVLTGVAAADKAGPAMSLSMVAAGMTCIFAALCYAEFAAMVPVAGSAYTYAYATLGELFAWIIGWDLVLEYAVGASTVAHGWSHYFQDLLKFFNGGKPLWPAILSNAPFDYQNAKFVWTASYLDLPAIVIVAIITSILVIGIKESANFNAVMVVVKLSVVFFVIVV